MEAIRTSLTSQSPAWMAASLIFTFSWMTEPASSTAGKARPTTGDRWPPLPPSRRSAGGRAGSRGQGRRRRFSPARRQSPGRHLRLLLGVGLGPLHGVPEHGVPDSTEHECADCRGQNGQIVDLRHGRPPFRDDVPAVCAPTVAGDLFGPLRRPFREARTPAWFRRSRACSLVAALLVSRAADAGADTEATPAGLAVALLALPVIEAVDVGRTGTRADTARAGRKRLAYQFAQALVGTLAGHAQCARVAAAVGAAHEAGVRNSGADRTAIFGAARLAAFAPRSCRGRWQVHRFGRGG